MTGSTHIEQLEKYNDSLCVEYIDIEGLKTAIYYPEVLHDGGENILMIHGHNGSYVGMTPLGKLLARSCNVFYVDLPGHGNSDIPSTTDIGGIDAWTMRLLEGIASVVAPDIIIAHSMASRIAVKATAGSAVRVLFLMPDVANSWIAEIAARVMSHIDGFALRLYSTSVVTKLRGFIFCRYHTAKSWNIISYLTDHTHQIPQKTRYQLVLASTLRPYTIPDSSNYTIVVGEYDVVSRVNYEELRQSYSAARVVQFPGGHVAPVEVAEELYGFLRKHDVL